MKVKEYDFSSAKQGAVVNPPLGTTLINFRIEDDILDWFQTQINEAGGGNYQRLMNEALREYIKHHESALEGTLRRVIREELRSMAVQTT